MVTYIVSCLIWRILYGKKIKVRRFAWGMGVGTGYAVLLMAVTFLTVHQISGDFRKCFMMFFPVLFRRYSGRNFSVNFYLLGGCSYAIIPLDDYILKLSYMGGLCYGTYQTLNTKSLQNTVKKGGCGECQTSCQSACKTSCTVGNQSCEHK